MCPDRESGSVIHALRKKQVIQHLICQYPSECPNPAKRVRFPYAQAEYKRTYREDRDKREETKKKRKERKGSGVRKEERERERERKRDGECVVRESAAPPPVHPATASRAPTPADHSAGRPSK